MPKAHPSKRSLHQLERNRNVNDACGRCANKDYSRPDFPEDSMQSQLVRPTHTCEIAWLFGSRHNLHELIDIV